MFGPFSKVKKYASPSAANVTTDAPGSASVGGKSRRSGAGFMPLANATVTWRNAQDQTEETAAILANVPIMVTFDRITANADILVGWS